MLTYETETISETIKFYIGCGPNSADEAVVTSRDVIWPILSIQLLS